MYIIQQVISERNSDVHFAKNYEDNPFKDQLRNMDIANELALLNRFCSKNNTASSNETGDLESSVSMDGSRTSENKMNDFVDYESSISVDGSRTEEHTRDDFIDYESSTNDGMAKQINGDIERSTITLPSNIHEIDEDVRLVDKSSSNSLLKEEQKVEITWSEDCEGNEDVTEDEEDEESLSETETLKCIKEDLETKKKILEEQYTKLYCHILKVRILSFSFYWVIKLL